MRAFVEEQTLAGERPDAVRAAFEAAHVVASQVGLRLRLPRVAGVTPGERAPRARPCDWPWTQGYISYEGLAMPCCMVGTPDRANFGSVVHRPFGEVWDGEEYRRFRSALASSEPPTICASCSVYRGIF